MCLHVYGCIYLDVSQKSTCGGSFSPSTMWAQGKVWWQASESFLQTLAFLEWDAIAVWRAVSFSSSGSDTLKVPTVFCETKC